MSGWSTSFLCTSFLLDALASTHTWNIAASGDTIKLAVYNNSGSYSVDTALATQAYASGAWVTGNEVTGTGWSAGGKTLGSVALANETGISGELNWSAANVSSTSTTLASVYGCLIYDSSVNSGANYGIAGIYFGGAYSVTAGTFAINWGTDGHSNSSIWYITT